MFVHTNINKFNPTNCKCWKSSRPHQLKTALLSLFPSLIFIQNPSPSHIVRRDQPNRRLLRSLLHHSSGRQPLVLQLPVQVAKLRLPKKNNGTSLLSIATASFSFVIATAVHSPQPPSNQVRARYFSLFLH